MGFLENLADAERWALFSAGLEGQNIPMLRLKMEEEKRKRQQGLVTSGLGKLSQTPSVAIGAGFGASGMRPEEMSALESEGMIQKGDDPNRVMEYARASRGAAGTEQPFAGALPGQYAFNPQSAAPSLIAQARSQMAMEAAQTQEQTQKSIQAAQYTKAINEAAIAPSEHARDLKLLEAHYAKGGSLQEFNAQRKKLRLESDTMGRIAALQQAAMDAQNSGILQSVSMGQESVAFSLRPPGGGTGDTFKDLSKTMEGFNNVRANLVETHAKMRKLPQEQAKIRAELALVSMKEFMSLAAVPGPIVKTKDGKEAQTPNPYVRKMIETYKAHLNVDWATFDWNDPNAIVGLADQMGEALATVGLGPKEAAAAQVSMWDDAISWLKGVGKGSDTGTAKPRSDEERYGRVFKRGISAGQRQ